MARQSAWLMGAAGVGLILCVAVLLIATSSAQRAGNEQQTNDWNNFSLPLMPPSSAQVAQLTTSASPAERATSAERIGRVVRPQLLPEGFAEHLLALEGWQGGNVFLARLRVGGQCVQVSEGARKLTVEVRRMDGQALAEQGANLANLARNVAQDTLSVAMQPREFHEVLGDPPRVAAWLTSDEPDPEGMRMHVCNAFSDGSFIRYEFHEETVPWVCFGGPPGHTFGKPTPPPVPIRKREVETPKPRKPDPAEWQGEIKAELTPEELANQVN